MLKLITITTAALVISTSAFAQSTGRSSAASNAFTKLTQAECTTEKGAIWKPSETWIRQADGKERVSRARCAFDPKAGKAIVAKLIDKR